LLEKSEGRLPPLDLSQGGGDATIVQLRLEELKPVANRLSVNVLVYLGISTYDNRFDVLAPTSPCACTPRATSETLPPFATWFAANLFAIVLLRNILPSAPPPGSWIDHTIVQWVLIALVTAMSLYIVAWIRQGD